jgi:1,5-anhydro-D-fructose reductase (1,5-anhydro-D-mannitol-forming)
MGAVQRWGIIGLGAQAENIARSLRQVEGVELVACASSSAERSAEFAATYGGTALSSNELLGSGLDLIVVAGVNADHEAHCIDAFSGGSAVLCEKPLALSLAGARAILEASRRAGLPLFTGYHYRFRVLAREIRDLVADGAIGEVRDVHMQRTSEHLTEGVRAWRHDLARAGAGVMCDVGVHLLDFVSFTTGLDIVALSALATPRRELGRPDEHAVVSLELTGGALGSIDVARALTNADNSLQIHGSAGSLYTGPLRWSDRVSVEVRRPGVDPFVLDEAVNNPLTGELAAVRDALAGQPSDLLAGAEAGLAGAAALGAVIESLEHGSRVELPPLGTA